jgi:hypothetical protein
LRTDEGWSPETEVVLVIMGGREEEGMTARKILRRLKEEE